jgi:hypothetical protein
MASLHLARDLSHSSSDSNAFTTRIATGMGEGGVMNWIRVALTVFAGGLVASLTDWLFMGDWLYKRYNQYPEIWRHPHGQGEMKAIAWYTPLPFVTCAVFAVLCACQEAKSPPQALGRSAGVILFCRFSAWCWPLGRGSYSRIEPDIHWLAQLVSSDCPARLSLCLPASLETNQREHRELALACPVGLKARPGRPRAEKTFASWSAFKRPYESPGRSLRNGSARDPQHQVSHQFPGHRQGGAVGIALLFFPIVE